MRATVDRVKGEEKDNKKWEGVGGLRRGKERALRRGNRETVRRLEGREPKERMVSLMRLYVSEGVDEVMKGDEGMRKK